MKITTVRKILIEDLTSKQALPDWLPSLLTPLNQFIDLVTLALRGNLTLINNISGNLFTLKFTHAVTLNIQPTTNTKIIGILPIFCENQAITSFKWVRNPQGTLGVTIGVSGGSATTTFNATVFLIPEVT